MKNKFNEITTDYKMKVVADKLFEMRAPGEVLAHSICTQKRIDRAYRILTENPRISTREYMLAFISEENK